MVDSHSTDEPLDRLRASDPATGSHPDLHRVRTLIAHKAPASQGHLERATAVDDDLLRGPRLRAPWIAAAAVALLGVGAGGYAVGLGAGSDTIVAERGGSDLRQDSLVPGSSGFESGAGMSSADSASASAGPMEESEYGTSSPSYDPGPVRLVAGEGLSTERTTGEVRTLVSDIDPETFLTQWSERTGLDGVRMGEDNAMYGGPGIYDPETGVMLSAYSGDGGAFSFHYENIFASEYCAEMYASMLAEDQTVMQEEWRKAMGEDVPFPNADSCREVTGENPTEEVALSTAREFLADAGVPVENYEFEVMNVGDTGSRDIMVDGWPENGRYGALSASVTVSAEGVVSAYGTLGEMESLGDYPVISPAEAVERYAQREFSMDYGVSLAEDYALEEISVEEYVEPVLPEMPPVEPGMKLPLLLKDKVVVDAELVQGDMWTQSGSMSVPTWKLITEDGMSYPVMAVAEESIDWQSWQ